MKNLKRNVNKGFTLIELVIVIVILGILAVTAAPTFLDLSGDANDGVAKSIGTSMMSADEVNYARNKMNSSVTRFANASAVFAQVDISDSSWVANGTTHIIHNTANCITFTLKTDGGSPTFTTGTTSDSGATCT